MADTNGTASVTDHRTAPKGVLPKNTQAWLMGGLAVAILAVIVMTGKPSATARRPAPPVMEQPAVSTDRARDYGERLRVLDTRARQQALASSARTPPPAPEYAERQQAERAPDPIEADRKRREYESLFASNVVVSRRPDGQRLATAPTRGLDAMMQPRPTLGATSAPSLDDVAAAVVRATTRYTPTSAAPPTVGVPGASPTTNTATALETAGARARRVASGPIVSTGPTHKILEGTLIDTVLTNRLDGATAAPVNCLVTNAVYSHDGQYVLIPQGSRVLGQTRPVQAFGETRLAVMFDRLVLPDGSTYPLERFTGLNDIGDAGLRDQVDQHYRSTFGAASAVGLITGFAQYLGGTAFSRSSGPTVIVAGGMSEATAQSTTQTMNRYLNRLPTVTIREGHRVKVYLTSDLELPAYGTASSSTGGALLAAAAEGGRP